MALYFDGINDNIQFGSLNVPANTNQFTMCAWVYKTKTANMYALSKSSGTSTGNNTWTIGIDRSNRFIGRLKIAGSTTELSTSGSYSSNVWYHLAMTYDGATIRLYVDGVLVASANRTGNVTVENIPFAIGTRGNSAFSREWEGEIKDARVYTRGLTEIEINIIKASQGSDYIVDSLLHWWPLREGADGAVPSIVYDYAGGANSTAISSSPLYRNDEIRVTR